MSVEFISDELLLIIGLMFKIGLMLWLGLNLLKRYDVRMINVLSKHYFIGNEFKIGNHMQKSQAIFINLIFFFFLLEYLVARKLSEYPPTI